ncbi:MAG: hydrogenase expression/formation protein HypC [Thermoprotei archaeon]|nr:MAG: hydrogenase expression/formation protein HypC [Thermoprotei archaeon]
MCWGVPARVVEIKGLEATVDFGGGVRRRVLIGASGVKEGDLVVVHAGVIIGKIEVEEALAMLEVYAELSAELTSGRSSQEEAEAAKRVLEELRRSLGL